MNYKKVPFNNYYLNCIYYIPSNFVDNKAIVLFIHGAGGQCKQWSRQFDFLTSENIPFVAFDFVGHGCSDNISAVHEYEFENLVAQALKVIEFVEQSLVHTKFKLKLVAHSYGTVVASYLAATDERVEKIVNLAPPAPLFGLSAETSDFFRLVKKAADTPLWVFNIWRLYDRFGGTSSRSVKRYVAPNAPLEVKQAQLGWNKQVRSRSIKNLFAGFKVLPPNLFASFNTPMLLLVGEFDVVTTPNSVASLCADFDSVFQTKPILDVIENAAHSLMYEQPTIVNIKIKEFLFNTKQ